MPTSWIKPKYTKLSPLKDKEWHLRIYTNVTTYTEQTKPFASFSVQLWHYKPGRIVQTDETWGQITSEYNQAMEKCLSLKLQQD